LEIIFDKNRHETAYLLKFGGNNLFMTIEPLFQISHEACIKCYSCVRICPVKAIRVDVANELPSIIPERCIGCGSCYRACAPHAIFFRSSIEETKAILASDSRVAAICDPTISGEFHDITDYRKFVEMIRQLGFTYVGEVSFGVDLVALKYKELFENFKGKYHFTANSHVMNPLRMESGLVIKGSHSIYLIRGQIHIFTNSCQ
jgi:NAD-dependent dihydropyrimidine dehydrogenase PreA subunit